MNNGLTVQEQKQVEEIKDAAESLEESIKQSQEDLVNKPTDFNPEVVAKTTYAQYLGAYANGVDTISGTAAKRILKGLLADPYQWVLPKFTMEVEKSVFQLAARLLESKFILMMIKETSEEQKEPVAVSEPVTTNTETNVNG